MSTSHQNDLCNNNQPHPIQWKVNDKTIDLTHHAHIMGILNITPDSFSDGGFFVDPELALQHALIMERDGATIIDVGGESTRPGASQVSIQEEIKRIRPIIRRLKKNCQTLISIDTTKAAVAEAALAEGADIINDISGCTSDPNMIQVVKTSSAGIILMHMQGNPQTMQVQPSYSNVTEEISQFLKTQINHCLQHGIDPKRIAIDPGFGFGKSLQHNITLFQDLPILAQLNYPILIGTSRKSMLAQITQTKSMSERSAPTIATTALGFQLGARLFRVHEVKPNYEALLMINAIATTSSK
jgi:dihydropteroate synthase